MAASTSAGSKPRALPRAVPGQLGTARGGAVSAPGPGRPEAKLPPGVWRQQENRIPRTALWIASDRRRTDPFAEPFLREAGELDSWGGSVFTVRTALFDECFRKLGPQMEQIVMLGAGLDTRAMRFPLPSGTTVYELDLPIMFRFKEPVLEGNLHLRHESARAARKTVACDFEKDDWPAELVGAGFNRLKPALWVMEGVVFYLTDQAVQSIFSRVRALSQCYSVVAFDCINKDFADFAGSLSREPGEHWGHNDPVGMVRQFGMSAQMSPAGPGRFFVTARVD